MLKSIAIFIHKNTVKYYICVIKLHFLLFNHYLVKTNFIELQIVFCFIHNNFNLFFLISFTHLASRQVFIKVTTTNFIVFENVILYANR